MLETLSDELSKQDITLRLAEVHAAARDLLRAEELETRVGDIDRFTSVADVVEHFQRGRQRDGEIRQITSPQLLGRHVAPGITYRSLHNAGSRRQFDPPALGAMAT